MMPALQAVKWLAERWYLPVIALAGVVGWMLGFRRETPQEVVETELKRIEQKQAVRRVTIQRGAEVANELLNFQYRQAISKLDTEQAEELERLLADPVSRLDYLRRVDEGIRRRGPDRGGRKG